MENYTLLTILNMAFSSSDSCDKHFEHPELIDVRNRFRIVEMSGHKYMVKRSKALQAETEIKNALEASRRLEDLSIGNIKVIVVVPQLFPVDPYSYIITPYLGKTLQSLRYEGDVPPFGLDFLMKLLEMLRNRGICYRGLLPRNMLLPNADTLYLIDWEDVVFYEEPAKASANLMCATNFELNWMYFFDGALLSRAFQKIMPMPAENEPSLIKYEKILCALMGINTDNRSTARTAVKCLVINAEKPFVGMGFPSIFPNDAGSVIADIFDPYIDVLFDLITNYVRESKYQEYSFWLNFLGIYVREHPNTQDYNRHCVFLIVLMMASPECHQVSLHLQHCHSDQLLSDLKVKYRDVPLVHWYCLAKEELLEPLLWNLLERITCNLVVHGVPEARTLIDDIILLSKKGINHG